MGESKTPPLPDGTFYEVIPLTFNRARIIHTDGVSVWSFW